jgi:enediyne biosynthesis protein E4
LSMWLPSTYNTPKKEYPAASRDELIKEMTFMKSRFGNYTSYSLTEMKDLFSSVEMQNTYQQTVQLCTTGWVENKGHFQFAWHDLPAETQWSPVFGVTINDWDADGNLDIALIGNDYGMAPNLGRNDALNGLILKGDGQGNFKRANIIESGFYVPGDGKALVQFVANGKLHIAASQNQEWLKVFARKENVDHIVQMLPNDLFVIYTLKNGEKRKEECYYGSSFLSQSARFVLVSNAIASITISNNKNENRTITFN